MIEREEVLVVRQQNAVVTAAVFDDVLVVEADLEGALDPGNVVAFLAQQVEDRRLDVLITEELHAGFVKSSGTGCRSRLRCTRSRRF